MSILVSSGCHYKITETVWHKGQKFSQFWSLMSMIKVPTDLVPVKGSLPGLQRPAFFLCPHMAERGGERELTCASAPSYRDTNPIMEASFSWPHWSPVTSQRPHIQVPSYWGIGLQYTNLGEGTQHSAHNNGLLECKLKEIFEKNEVVWKF